MKRLVHEDLNAEDQTVLARGGGVFRTEEQYALLSSGWDVSPIGDPPHATSVHVRSGESIVVVRCSGTPVCVHRSPEHMDVYGDWVKLIFSTSGSVSIRQRGRAVEVTKGEMGSVVYAEPFKIVQRQGADTHLIYLSGDSLRTRGLAMQRLAGQVWSGGPLLPTLDVLLEQLFVQSDRPPLMAVENVLLDMVAAAMASSSENVDPDDVRRKRMTTVIAGQFHNPELNADTIAKQLGVSRRSLYGLVREGDMSVAETIRFHRVRHGRLLLATRHDLSLHGIAKMCGFKGADQFARAFKTVTGVTPGVFRTRP